MIRSRDEEIEVLRGDLRDFADDLEKPEWGGTRAAPAGYLPAPAPGVDRYPRIEKPAQSRSARSKVQVVVALRACALAPIR